MIDRQPLALKASVQRIETRQCGLVRNDPSFFHHRIFDDEESSNTTR